MDNAVCFVNTYSLVNGNLYGGLHYPAFELGPEMLKWKTASWHL